MCEFFEGQFICHEKHGTVLRTVLEIEPSFVTEAYLSEKLSGVPGPMKDLNHIYSYGARLFLVDDVGMLFKGTIEFEGMPDVHIGFWDRVLRGREEMCRSMVEWFIQEEHVPGLWTAMPPSARATLAFAKRVGFTEYAASDSAVVLTLVT